MSERFREDDETDEDDQETINDRKTPEGVISDPDDSAIQGVTDTQSVQEQKAIEKVSEIERLQPDEWEKLNEGEKLKALQDVEYKMAEVQERPPAEVIVSPGREGEFGAYDSRTNQINIGSYSLEHDSEKELVDTVVHEGRHAYQRYAVDNPGFHTDAGEVEQWRQNFSDYKSFADYGQEEYEGQPIEADAWSYGQRIANGLFGWS